MNNVHTFHFNFPDATTVRARRKLLQEFASVNRNIRE
jgi:hypothetical protein